MKATLQVAVAKAIAIRLRHEGEINVHSATLSWNYLHKRVEGWEDDVGHLSTQQIDTG